MKIAHSFGLNSDVAGSIYPSCSPPEKGLALSVVVPMYRERERITETLDDLTNWLQTWDLTSEIILVDDGSPDDTADIVQPFITDEPQGHLRRVRLHKLENNLGKGGAVREGLRQARGQNALIMDADNAATIREVEKLLPSLTHEVGIVAGSRALKSSDVEAVKYRAFTGLIFRAALAALGMNVIRDTQCGFKLYSRDAITIIDRFSNENGYTFDLEHMLLVKRAGLDVVERGIAWKHIEGGQVSALSDGLRMLRESVRLKSRIAALPSSHLRHAVVQARKPRQLVEAKPGRVAATAG